MQDNAPLKSGCNDKWRWDVLPNNPCIITYDTQRLAVFRPPADGICVGVQGTKAVNGRRAYWELELCHKEPVNTFICGIAVKDPAVRATGRFGSPMGDDRMSWGLTRYGLTFHNDRAQFYTGYLDFDTLGVYFDGIGGTLSFYSNGTCLGVAFQELEKIQEPLFPTVACRYGLSGVVLKKARRDFSTLGDLCCDTIAQFIRKEKDIRQLEIPETLKWDLRNYEFSDEFSLVEALAMENATVANNANENE